MIIWIDGTFGAGKTTIANELNKKCVDSEAIDFDEFVRTVEPQNLMEIIFGKRYPQGKKLYIDAFVEHLNCRLKQNDNKSFIVPMALITDYCKDNLVDELKCKTDTIHFILDISKNKLLERLEKQPGRDNDFAITYYEEATSYLDRNYPDAIRISTDNMMIEEITCSIEKILSDRR